MLCLMPRPAFIPVRCLFLVFSPRPLIFSVSTATTGSTGRDMSQYQGCGVDWGVRFLRLDGSTNKIVRELDIREFNAPNSAVFIYLISTRAGGVDTAEGSSEHEL